VCCAQWMSVQFVMKTVDTGFGDQKEGCLCVQVRLSCTARSTKPPSDGGGSLSHEIRSQDDVSGGSMSAGKIAVVSGGAAVFKKMIDSEPGLARELEAGFPVVCLTFVLQSRQHSSLVQAAVNSAVGKSTTRQRERSSPDRFCAARDTEQRPGRICHRAAARPYRARRHVMGKEESVKQSSS